MGEHVDNSTASAMARRAPTVCRAPYVTRLHAWASPMLAALTLSLALLAVAAAAGGVFAQTRGDETAPPRRTVLRFLTTNDFPPFNYLDEEGVLNGFNVDLARAICLDLNVSCDISSRPWEDLFAALNRRQADAVIAGHIVTSRALAQVEFTERYFHTPGRFVGRRGGPKLEITPDGLDGRSIGVAKGTTHEAFLLAFFRSSAIRRFETQELARDALVSRQVDLVFDDGISLILWINGELSKGCCELKGGPYLEPKYFGDGVAIAVAKGDYLLRNELNAALRRLRESGRFEELVLRYFPYRVF